MQRYTEIPSSKTLTESLPLILNNDKTVMSCSAGTAFPTTNLQQGMLCYKTNDNKLYQLTDLTGPTWRVVADLSGDARNLDGGFGNVIDYDKQNLNSWQNMPTGFYQGTNMLNAPNGDTAWRVIQIRYGNSDGYATQIAFGVSTGKVCTRYQSGGLWSAWQDFQIGADGKVIPNLNADKVDDKEPGNASGNIAVNNGTLNTNLNADKLDGYHAGNKSGNIPISNGVVNLGFNADQVDGYHVGNETGQIPINNGKLNKGLNAETINGVTIDTLLRINGNGDFDRNINNAVFSNASIGNLSVSGVANVAKLTGYINTSNNIIAPNVPPSNIGAKTFTAGASSYGSTIYVSISRDVYGRLTSLGVSGANCDCNCDCSDGDNY